MPHIPNNIPLDELDVVTQVEDIWLGIAQPRALELRGPAPPKASWTLTGNDDVLSTTNLMFYFVSMEMTTGG